MFIAQFKLSEENELAESDQVLSSDYKTIQYEVLPEISLPNGANHGLITGPKTERDNLAH